MTRNSWLPRVRHQSQAFIHKYLNQYVWVTTIGSCWIVPTFLITGIFTFTQEYLVWIALYIDSLVDSSIRHQFTAVNFDLFMSKIMGSTSNLPKTVERSFPKNRFRKANVVKHQREVTCSFPQGNFMFHCFYVPSRHKQAIIHFTCHKKVVGNECHHDQFSGRYFFHIWLTTLSAGVPMSNFSRRYSIKSHTQMSNS